MKLRTATTQDLAMLEHWQSQAHVIEAVPDIDWNWSYELPRQPGWRELFIAELKNKPIGLIQIIDPAEEETQYWGKVEPNLRALDIWIGEKDMLNQGYGSQMMQLAIQHCFASQNVNAVLLDPLASNTRSHRFYERLGFVLVEKRYFNQDYCFIYRLDRSRWQAAKPKNQ